MQAVDASRWRSVTQIVREVGISPSRVRELITTGRFRAEKTALGWLVDPESIAAFERERAARLARIAARKGAAQ